MDNYIDKIRQYLLKSEKAKALSFTEDVKIEFLAQGEYNKNYTVTQDDMKYVFRINMGSQLNLRNQIEYEYNAIKKLESSGVTPTGYFVDDSRLHFDEGVLMMNYLEGKPLDYKIDLDKAARIFASIHQLDPSDFSNILITENDLCKARVDEGDFWLESFRKSSIPCKDTKRLMEALYSYCKKNAREVDAFFNENPWLVVNNTEVNSHNFIIGQDKSYLIDWEKPVISDPVQDITQFLAPTTTLWKTSTKLTEKEMDAFFDTYGKLMGRSVKERVKAYEPFLYLRAFSWCAGAYITYSENTRAIQNQETFNVIKSYLEPSFMEEILYNYIKST